MAPMRSATATMLLALACGSLTGCPETKPDPCPAGTMPVAERCEPIARDAAAEDAATGDAGEMDASAADAGAPVLDGASGSG